MIENRHCFKIINLLLYVIMIMNEDFIEVEINKEITEQITDDKYTTIYNANSKNHRMPIDKNIRDVIYFVDYNIYLQEIEQDFIYEPGIFFMKRMNKEKILKQFTRDVSGCDIKLNDVPIKNHINMVNYLLNNYTDEIAYRTMMLSTQASLGMPCIILQNIFTNLYLVEMNYSKRYYRINITTTKNSIHFEFNKNLRLIDNDKKTKYNIYIKIEFDILNDPNVLMYFTIKKPKLNNK